MWCSGSVRAFRVPHVAAEIWFTRHWPNVIGDRPLVCSCTCMCSCDRPGWQSKQFSWNFLPVLPCHHVLVESAQVESMPVYVEQTWIVVPMIKRISLTVPAIIFNSFDTYTSISSPSPWLWFAFVSVKLPFCLSEWNTLNEVNELGAFHCSSISIMLVKDILSNLLILSALLGRLHWCWGRVFQMLALLIFSVVFFHGSPLLSLDVVWGFSLQVGQYKIQVIFRLNYEISYFRGIDYLWRAGSECRVIGYLFPGSWVGLIPNTVIIFSPQHSNFLISHPFCTMFMYAQRHFLSSVACRHPSVLDKVY